jgi:tripartite-type tricarboxylate transporter receptor subunit TctC
MASLTFDTLKFTRTLEKAGVPTEQAEAFSNAFKDASAEAEVASKRDVERLDAKLDKEFSTLRAEVVVVKAEMSVIKWMLGLLLAGVTSLVLKQFF